MEPHVTNTGKTFHVVQSFRFPEISYSIKGTLNLMDLNFLSGLKSFSYLCRDGNFTTANPLNQSSFEVFENVSYSLTEILDEVTISTADSNDSKGKKL